MSLPAAWVEKIFQKLSLTYGRDFTIRWEGLSLDDVKADWGHELSRLQANPGAIRYGLESLPDNKPPTVLEFRALCNRRPDAAPPMLEAPRPDPVAAAKVMAAVSTVGKPTPAEFMLKLDADVRAGNASPARIRHHRIATENGYYGSGVSSVEGDFVPITKDLWPVGMHLPSAGQRLPSKRLAADFEVI